MSATLTLNYVVARQGSVADGGPQLQGHFRLGTLSDDDALIAALKLADLAISLGSEEANVTLWDRDRNIANVQHRRGEKGKIALGSGHKPTCLISN